MLQKQLQIANFTFYAATLTTTVTAGRISVFVGEKRIEELKEAAFSRLLTGYMLCNCATTKCPAYEIAILILVSIKPIGPCCQSKYESLPEWALCMTKKKLRVILHSDPSRNLNQGLRVFAREVNFTRLFTIAFLVNGSLLQTSALRVHRLHYCTTVPPE